MSIRVREQEFPITSAELTYIRLPNNTIEVMVEIRAKGEQLVTLSLYPPRLPGRSLHDLTGQVQVLASPTKPDRYGSRSVDVVAGIYAGTHEDVFDSRIEWGAVDERGIALRWTGRVHDLDFYCSDAKYPLVVDAKLPAVERPHRYVFARYSQGEEASRVAAVKERVVQSLAESLVARRWFDGMPFVAVEIVVSVETKGHTWRPLPSLPANEPPFILARLPRALVVSGDDAAIQRALELEINDGLEQLEKRYRQSKPSFL